MPASMSATAQGPVRPVWLHGSSVTTAVAPSAAPCASLESASTSAWAVPAPRCHPSASTSPCGERITHPTRGFTPRAGPRSASSRARRIAAASAIVCSTVVIPCPVFRAPGDASAMPRCRSPHHRLRTAQPTRAASHPDFHRRYRNSTGSTARARPLGRALAVRGLSPPVRNYTDPGARFLVSILGQRVGGRAIPVISRRSAAGQRHWAAAAICASEGRPYISMPAPGRS